jgi:enolase
VGDEGGLAPVLSGDEEALKLISSLGKIKIALDMAGVVPQNLTIDTIVTRYPVVSLEDPAKEDDFFNLADLTQKYQNKIMLVGDDVFATNCDRLKKGLELHLANAVLVKPNQIGTISEAIQFVNLAKSSGYKTVVSHRSGETEDSFIADFAVGVGANYVKFGGTCRGERISKYNRLLRIEETIGG